MKVLILLKKLNKEFFVLFGKGVSDISDIPFAFLYLIGSSDSSDMCFYAEWRNVFVFFRSQMLVFAKTQ
ncbi:hypothetical protein D7322_02160 [Sphingobacterium puteale]|uniref:Uncharacterized protein n=1 Tax=Sphingobacterium puteale TaxID=2420510 RepID=A0A420W4M2_9SPHI|nr:hypothetical protein D7322_02160 [Sphingobacterium puteale]